MAPETFDTESKILNTFGAATTEGNKETLGNDNAAAEAFKKIKDTPAPDLGIKNGNGPTPIENENP